MSVIITNTILMKNKEVIPNLKVVKLTIGDH